MTDLKKMTVAASGKLRQIAYDILNEQTNLLAWQQGGSLKAGLQKRKGFILSAISRSMRLCLLKRQS